MGYDQGDSFPFDFEPNEITFGLKSNGKLSPRSYPIQCERKWKYSILSVGIEATALKVGFKTKQQALSCYGYCEIKWISSSLSVVGFKLCINTTLMVCNRGHDYQLGEHIETRIFPSSHI